MTRMPELIYDDVFERLQRENRRLRTQLASFDPTVCPGEALVWFESVELGEQVKRLEEL